MDGNYSSNHGTPLGIYKEAVLFVKDTVDMGDYLREFEHTFILTVILLSKIDSL